MKFVFIRSNTLACRLIRAIDGGGWSHCAMSADAGGVWTDSAVEAVWPGGVRVRNWSSLLAARPDHLVLDVPLPNEHQAAVEALSWQGAPYDWRALPALAIRRLFGAAPMWARPDAWYCSELLLAACAAGGAPIKGPLRRYGVAAAFAHVQSLVAKKGIPT